MLGLDSVLWWTLKGSAILGCAAIAAWLLRRRPAAVRHVVWTIAIGAQLLVPLAPHVLPADSFGIAVPAMPQAAVTRLTSSRSAPTQPSVPLPFPADVARPAPAVQEPRPASSSRPITSILLLALAAGSALHLVRLLLGWRRLVLLARSAAPVSEAEWLASLHQYCRALGITRPVALIRSDAIQIPVTWGVRQPRLLLPESSRSWPPHVRRQVLLHELAHIRRRDPLWQLLAQGAVIACWFNPLLRLAVGRMRIEAEHACDDYVLRGGERPSSYAATLVDLVSACAGVPLPATLSVAQRSDLESRVAAVLSPSRDAAARRTLLAVSIALALVIILPLAALQRVSARPMAPLSCRPLMIPNFKYSQTSGSMTLPDKTTRYYFFLRPEPDRWLEASFSLDARFTADDRGLVPTPGLHALIREKRGALDRAVYLDEAGGKLAHRYLVDGRAATWDAKAERWLAGAMPDVIRRTEAGIPDRVQRILTHDGVDDLLAEVPRLAVIDVRRLYLLELLAIPPAQLPRARLVAAGRENLGVHEVTFAAFLADLVAREGSSDDLRRLVLAEIGSLHQGGSRLAVMQAMLEHADPTVQRSALDNLRLVPEDLWRRDLLLASAPHALATDSPLTDAWFAALATLREPFYRRELRASMHTLHLPAAIVDRLAAELG